MMDIFERMARWPKRVRSFLELLLIVVLSIYISNWISSYFDYLQTKTIEQDRRDSYFSPAQYEPIPQSVNDFEHKLSTALTETLTSLVEERKSETSMQVHVDKSHSQLCINGYGYEVQKNGQLKALVIPDMSGNDKVLKQARPVRCTFEFYDMARDQSGTRK
ncbi:hypothetical protein ACR3LR_03245 [Pantoea eucalypti]|uniref:hypothetical protein n=1 Tax=Pantoea eucalypti TaxID=470933 RepID=UPI003EE46A02